MDLIVCLDDRNGMMFNGRRQSRDRAVIEDILRDCAGRLYIEGYSEPLFAGRGAEYTVTQELASAGAEASCFAERPDGIPDRGAIQRVTVYRWNRLYPADMYFAADLNEDFELVQSSEFEGTSHKKITKEVWERRNGHEK